MEKELTKKEIEAQEKATELAESKEIVDRLEAANKVKQELLDREEMINAQKELGGQSEAGAVPIKEEPLSDLEYAKAVMAGKADPFKSDVK